MYEVVDKTKDNKSRAVIGSVTQKKNKMKQDLGFEDNRPASVVQRKMQAMIDSPDSKLVQRHKKGVFDAGEGAKWHIEFNHIKFRNNSAVNFTDQTKKQKVIEKLRNSYQMTNRQLRRLDYKTWIACSKWLKSNLK